MKATAGAQNGRLQMDSPDHLSLRPLAPSVASTSCSLKSITCLPAHQWVALAILSTRPRAGQGSLHLLQPQSNQSSTCLACRWVALAISVYLLAVHLILYNVRRIVHVEAAYFASLNGSLMWWTYLRNLGEVVLGRVSFWHACMLDGLTLHQEQYVLRCSASLRSSCAARDLSVSHSKRWPSAW